MLDLATRDRVVLPERSGFARRPVAAISLAVLTVLLAASPWYGYHRDELYFRMLGERPALGYFDTPPLAPMIARVSVSVFGDTVIALRIVPALCAALLVVLVALICRELGGGRSAQLLAAGGMAMSGMTLIAGHMLLALTPDMTLWTATILFTLRAVLRADGRWWLAAGAVIGLATYNRLLVALLVIAVAAGILVSGPRRALWDRWLWVGALLAVTIALPNLIYQATHDWPQFQMASALSADEGAGNRVRFVPMQLILLGPAYLAIQVVGLITLWRDKRTRCFAVAYPVAFTLVLFAGGRPDYTIGLLVLLFVAGCAPTIRWMTTLARRRLVVAALVVNLLIALPMALPLLPAPSLKATPVKLINESVVESIGWPQFAGQLAGVLRSLPPEDQARTVFLAENYGQAGAIDRYATDAGLPAVYSGHNELYWRGSPPETARIIVMATDKPAQLAARFASCTEHGVIDDGVDSRNEEQGKPILVCRNPIRPWSQLWPEFRHYF